MYNTGFQATSVIYSERPGGKTEMGVFIAGFLAADAEMVILISDTTVIQDN